MQIVPAKCGSASDLRKALLMKIISADQRLAERLGMKALSVGPSGVDDMIALARAAGVFSGSANATLRQRHRRVPLADCTLLHPRADGHVAALAAAVRNCQQRGLTSGGCRTPPRVNQITLSGSGKCARPEAHPLITQKGAPRK
jgi:hypothetical protein